MSELERIVQQLRASGATVVAIYPSENHAASPPEQPVDEIPPYPLQPWAKQKIQRALSVPMDHGYCSHGPPIWTPQWFQKETRLTPLGRKITKGWMLTHRDPGVGEPYVFYVGERLMVAVWENFPEYINWGGRLDHNGNRIDPQ